MQIANLKGIITTVIINIVHCLVEFCLDVFENWTCFLNHVQNKSHGCYNTPSSKVSLLRMSRSDAYVIFVIL
jgi:hypothetical protein